MKERVDATKMLREPSVNGPVQDTAVSAGVIKLDSADIKLEAKEEEGRKSGDSRPPSRKLSNGDPDGKTENGKPGSVGSEGQKASPQSATQHPASGTTTPANMIPSQHGMATSHEPPFMQQQSEIFVFSTRLANEAAESVRNGHCKSIIQYHMDHPNTKAFLQKNPLNASGFRHSIPPGMPGNLKGQPGPGMIRMPGPSPPNWGPHQTPPGLENPNMMDPRGMMPNGPYPPGGPRMMGGWGGQGCSGPHPHMHPGMGPGGFIHGNMIDLEAEMMMGGPQNLSNISSSQVPDENLTLEQRQHRSKGLAQLTKIHQMLMGDSGPHDGRQPHMGHDGHPPSMYPCGPRIMSPAQQQAMMSQQQSMMSHGGMMPPHGMMSPQHQHMMAHQGMPPYGPGCPPGMVPMGMNGKEQFQAQHDWFHCQREYYIEKQHRMQHMAANRGPHMEQGPPPSYYSSVSQRHGGMSGPPSPTMNGIRMIMPPHGPMGPGMDSDGMGMFGGPPDMCRPPHMGMEPMPGMHGYPPHGMPPQGAMDPGFDPTLSGGMSPGMVTGPPGPGGRRLHGSMRQGHMMGPNGMMPNMKGSNQVTLHRAGNPEQFNPETMGGVVLPVSAPSSNSSKPPPSYAQAQKRKRTDDLDDSYTKGNLQQTPSPTKIHYHLSQFEGQELTITKQLNSAYVAGNGDDVTNSSTGGGGNGGTGGINGISGNSGAHFSGHTNSPLHCPGSNKGPHSNSSQTSVHMVNSPVVSTAGPSPHQCTQGPGTPHSTPLASAAPSSGANMRLSHFDPAPMSNGVGSAPHTPNPKPSSMSNITSASLANLAKGVENLSNQMQQNMMQGGPFHSIQVQGQISSSNSSSNSSNSSSNSSNNGSSATTTTSSSSYSSSLSSHAGSVISSQTQSVPSVNNTYIATNMSISQVNVPNHPSMNSYVNMQMQNMSTESTHVNMPSCGGVPHMAPGMTGSGPRPGMPHHMGQSPAMMPTMCSMTGGPSPGMGQGPPLSSGSLPSGMNHIGLIPPHRPNSSSSMPATPPTMSKSQFTSPPLTHPQNLGPLSHPMPDVTSPSFPITSSSNSSVQIQQKGHNTIQYLPANPPSSQTSAVKHRPDTDYNMPRFPSPLQTIDGKHPSSTLQYFPNPSPTGSRPPAGSSALSAAAAMGPEFVNQATIAMHQSASMMQSSSIPDLHVMQGGGPGMPPSSMGPMMPMDSPGQMGDPHMTGQVPMMVGPDPMMGMGNLGHMMPSHSPGSMRPLPPGVGPSSLECVSPIPGMGGYMNNGPSIEQAQAQAQAHAAMMMQGNNQMPISSPHGHMPTGGGPSPHMTPMGPMSGSSLHGPMPPGGMSGPSVLGPMPGQSPHGPPMPVQSPLGPMPGSMPGPNPHGPMPSSVQGMSPHGPMMGPSSHSSITAPMPPHGHMGHMHGAGIPPSSLSRHPGMGGMRMVGPGMSGQYGMQYPGYQQDYYTPGPPRGHPRQMMTSMMGGPGQPYGMMPGPS